MNMTTYIMKIVQNYMANLIFSIILTGFNFELREDTETNYAKGVAQPKVKSNIFMCLSYKKTLIWQKCSYIYIMKWWRSTGNIQTWNWKLSKYLIWKWIFTFLKELKWFPFYVKFSALFSLRWVCFSYCNIYQTTHMNGCF